MLLQPLPAFTDNYIWTLRESPAGAPIVVDPGDAAPVLAMAGASGVAPAALLLTHHHPDHVGGAAELLRHWPGLPVFAPVDERIEVPCTRVGDGDIVGVGPWRFEVLAVPGHTSSHIAFHGDGLLFCGDTLFSLGCGRLFEGTPAQMLASLDRLAALPPQVRVCCGHEYTLANAAFAAAIEPANAALHRRTGEARALRERDVSTLPSLLADELAANPFLRVDAPAVRAAAGTRLGRAPADRVETFAVLRQWKDDFAA